MVHIDVLSFLLYRQSVFSIQVVFLVIRVITTVKNVAHIIPNFQQQKSKVEFIINFLKVCITTT